ncbi:hypothetical protein [Amycolatopsis viridis]|uniref:Secreted protein n=1 Tax=Amycolatopsis viridis TaxID=185678 RepID=A0ABX0SM36_9PSEU|nr:hypothetical protein [Amycolatopsis viridis]NIH78048.1 hypothetical protein [Amycolatopsis viridis]
MRRVMSWAMATLATAGIVVAAAPTAAAAPGEPQFFGSCDVSLYTCQDGAKVSAPGPHDRCGTGPEHTKVCIRYDGDVVYVQDGSSDGRAVMAVIEQYTGKHWDNARLCRNPHGHGTWARCRFDWKESATKVVQGSVLLSTSLTRTETLWSFENN